MAHGYPAGDFGWKKLDTSASTDVYLDVNVAGWTNNMPKDQIYVRRSHE